jgi:plasmid stabilization system protein ParE
MTKPVRTTPTADAHIERIDTWWRENRDKAPDLFREELVMAIRTIASAPSAGRRHPHPDADVRRVLLRSTRHHVYYVDHTDHVLVVAVWGAIKDAGPDLTGL